MCRVIPTKWRSYCGHKFCDVTTPCVLCHFLSSSAPYFRSPFARFRLEPDLPTSPLLRVTNRRRFHDCCCCCGRGGINAKHDVDGLSMTLCVGRCRWFMTWHAACLSVIHARFDTDARTDCSPHTPRLLQLTRGWLKQDPNAGNSHVAVSSAGVSRRRNRFRALPGIGSARRWLRLTGKVTSSLCSIVTL